MLGKQRQGQGGWARANKENAECKDWGKFKYENLSSDPSITSELDAVVRAWDLRVGKTEKGISLGLMASQPSWLGEHSVQKLRQKVLEGRHLTVTSGFYKAMHTHARVLVDRQSPPKKLSEIHICIQIEENDKPGVLPFSRVVEK